MFLRKLEPIEDVFLPNSGIEWLIVLYLYQEGKAYGKQIADYLFKNELMKKKLNSTIYNCLKSLETKKLIIKGEREGRIAYYFISEAGQRLVKKSRLKIVTNN